MTFYILLNITLGAIMGFTMTRSINLAAFWSLVGILSAIITGFQFGLLFAFAAFGEFMIGGFLGFMLGGGKEARY